MRSTGRGSQQEWVLSPTVPSQSPQHQRIYLVKAGSRQLSHPGPLCQWQRANYLSTPWGIIVFKTVKLYELWIFLSWFFETLLWLLNWSQFLLALLSLCLFGRPSSSTGLHIMCPYNNTQFWHKGRHWTQRVRCLRAALEHLCAVPDSCSIPAGVPPRREHDESRCWISCHLLEWSGFWPTSTFVPANTGHCRQQHVAVNQWRKLSFSSRVYPPFQILRSFEVFIFENSDRAF